MIWVVVCNTQTVQEQNIFHCIHAIFSNLNFYQLLHANLLYFQMLVNVIEFITIKYHKDIKMNGPPTVLVPHLGPFQDLRDVRVAALHVVAVRRQVGGHEAQGGAAHLAERKKNGTTENWKLKIYKLIYHYMEKHVQIKNQIDILIIWKNKCSYILNWHL